MAMTKSNLDLASITDNFPYPGTANDGDRQFLESYWTLIWLDEEGEYPIGYLPYHVLQEVIKVPAHIKGDMILNEDKKTILMFQYPTEAERSLRAASLAQHWRSNGTFKILKTWRDESWPVFGRKGEPLFSVERAVVGLLGATRYGVHLTAYVRDDTVRDGYKFWIPRRAATKSTFPGMLDNTAAGGLMTGEEPFECIIREADEEASLPEHIVRSRAECTGTITYIHVSDEELDGQDGLVYPECQWVYDLELPKDIVPEPKDGEAENFRLFTVEQVQRDMAAGAYKHNCAVVMIDFFMRHGLLTYIDEDEVDLIRRKLHRVLPFPGPRQTSQP